MIHLQDKATQQMLLAQQKEAEKVKEMLTIEGQKALREAIRKQQEKAQKEK